MKKIIFSLACMGLMTLTACDDYLDINDSPNAISSVENDYILPTPEVNIASTVGVQFNVLGGTMPKYMDKMQAAPTTSTIHVSL